MISRPVPFDIPYSILLDSSGNGSFTYNFANDYWYAATVSGENSGGTPVWNIRRNNVILQPAVGTQVAMSAGVMSPGTALVITVSGGIPGSNVSGLIYGAKSSDPSELTVPVALPSSPGVIQVPQRFQLKVKASDPSFIYTVPYDGLVHTFVFTLPPGSLSARWYFNQPQGTPPASWTQLHISGNNTNPPWGTYTAGFDGEGGLATETVDEDANFRLWPGDTQLIITAQFAANGTNAAPFRFMLEASLSQEIVRAALTGDGPSASSNIGIFADGAITTTIVSNQDVATKAARLNGIASGADLLAAPSTGYKLFGLLGVNRTGGAGFIELYVSGVGICDLFLPAINTPFYVPLSELPVNAAIVLNYTGGNTIDGQLYYSGS